MKQKCSLEKSYAEGLLKLSTNFQNKKIANIPDVECGAEDATNTTSEKEKSKRRVSLSGDDNPSGAIFHFHSIQSIDRDKFVLLIE